MTRVYLDHNATTPLRREARDAMREAMDVVGNPSSVHAEGRAAKMLVERARAQVADLVGCRPAQVIFTASATEAAALAAAQKHRYAHRFAALPTEHDCIGVWSDVDLPSLYGRDGAAVRDETGLIEDGLLAVSAANSETGLMRPNGRVAGSGDRYGVLCDITQIAGKLRVEYESATPAYAILSAHKMGGPKGVGALINFTADDPEPMLRGGGQEMNRRSGTENVIGIAGFGAAAEAARLEIDRGVWDEVAQLRNILENAIAAASDTTIFVGKGARRLPNTSCMISPGWKGETQVMQMDLAGFAISAGSACSSGKVRASKVLSAMGFDENAAASAIRVSLGPRTTEEEIRRFAQSWTARYEKHAKRAA